MNMTVASLLQHIVDDMTSIDAAWLSITVDNISLNSTKVSSGGAFIAVPGVTSDGRNYIERCEAAHVIFAHVDSYPVTHRLTVKGVPIIEIVQLDKKVSMLAANFYRHPSRAQTIVGITGTNGKTTCAHFLAQVISQCAGYCGHIGTLGYSQFIDGQAQLFEQTGMTTPSPIKTQELLAGFAKENRFVAMEVSSHGLVQYRVSGVSFKGAVFTNLSREHLDFHPNLESYFEAKAKLFLEYDLDFAVINIDDAWGEKIAQRLALKKVNVYGVMQKNTNRSLDKHIEKVAIENFAMNETGLSASLISPWGRSVINTGLFGEYNAMNIALVAASACATGLKWADVIKAINTLKAVPGRLQKVESDKPFENPVVFVDFAHTPDALENVLTQIKRLCKGKLWVVVGCGGDRDKGKRELMAKAAINNADNSVFTTDNPRSEEPKSIFNDMTQGLTLASYKLIENRKHAIEYVIENATPEDVVVIAGKGHEKYQIIENEYIPFDDVLVAQAVLNNKSIQAGMYAI